MVVMMAIVTRFLGQTKVQRARVKASCEAGSVVILWEVDVDAETNHRLAREALVKKLNWTVGTWVTGFLSNGSQVHVRVIGDRL